MNAKDRRNIVKAWNSSRYTKYSPAMIADQLNIPRAEVRAVIEEERAKRREKVASYKITQHRRDGLRLVMVYAHGSEMRWWTDRDKSGVKQYVEALKDRITQGDQTW